MPKNIEMSVLNSEGSYDVLYPATKSEITILSEKIIEQFGLEDGAVIDNALNLLFRLVAGSSTQFAVGVNVSLNGEPLVGYVVNGLEPIIGDSVVTDDSGYAFGYAPQEKVTLSINPNWVDVDNYSQELDTQGKVFTEITVNFVRNNIRELDITSSKTIKFSKLTTKVDFFAVGGGGGGAVEGDYSYWEGLASALGGGGCGGQTNTLLNWTNVGEEIQCIIGSGGTGANLPSRFESDVSYNGNNGGNTIIKVGSNNILTANGGDGGLAGGGAGNYVGGSTPELFIQNNAKSGVRGGNVPGAIAAYTFDYSMGKSYTTSSSQDGGNSNSTPVISTVSGRNFSGPGYQGQGKTTSEFEEGEIFYSNAGQSIGIIAMDINPYRNYVYTTEIFSGGGKGNYIYMNNDTVTLFNEDSNYNNATSYGCGGGGFATPLNVRSFNNYHGGNGYQGLIKVRWQ